MIEAKTILLVEDDEPLRYALMRQLTAKGYQVVAVEGSMAALNVLDSQRTDVLISDVFLGKREPHGVALARMVSDKFPATSIILITGSTDKIDDNPAKAVFMKPVNIDALVRAIETR